MPYQINPEWLQEAAPVLASLPMDKMERHAVQDIAIKRKNAEIMCAHVNSLWPMPKGVTIAKHELTSFDGATIAVYRFSTTEMATANAPGPAILHFHGGGFFACSVASFDRYIATLAAGSGVPVFSVEYRKAPEMQGLGLVKDCYAALTWLHDKAVDLCVDPARIALVGESAGGSLAAGVSLYARDQRLNPMPAKQLLNYPALDYRTQSASSELASFLAWNAEENILAWSALLGRDVAREKVEDIEGLQYMAPATATDLKGLPDAFLETGTLDLLASEAIDYARRLLIEGHVQVEMHVYPGVAHGWDMVGWKTSLGQVALQRKIAVLRSL